jgi:hypothetical protein
LHRGKMALRQRFSCVIKPSVPCAQTSRLRRRGIGKNAFLGGASRMQRFESTAKNLSTCSTSQATNWGKFCAHFLRARRRLGVPERRASGAGAAAAPKTSSSRAGGQRLAVENSGRTWYVKKMQGNHRHIVAIY